MVARLGKVVRHVRRLVDIPSPRGTNDRELLEAFVAGDQGAFTTLVERHGPAVLGVCKRVLKHEQDAEDAFQATFLTLARKARSIRKGEALASWLHGVALRTALKYRRDEARRRTHEGRVIRAAVPCPSWEAAWREVQALLDEEVAGLPEKYRAVFVLCCLHGRSRAEAALELGLNEGTIWSRLAEARRLLRRRLASRGIALSAVLAAGALARPAGALPPRLVRAALAGACPAGGAVRCLLAGILLLAGGLVAASALARRPAPPAPAAVKVPEKPGPDAAVEVKGDAVEVRGRVLGPDGKPFPGAHLFLASHVHPPGAVVARTLRATSGKDGRYSFSFPPSETLGQAWLRPREHPWRALQVVAVAPGHGPAWAPLGKFNAGRALRLVEEGVPLKGRATDLQGRPVPGASVEVAGVESTPDEWLHGAWLGPRRGLTGKDGAFALAGVGPGRRVRLRIGGATIETRDILVKAERGKELLHAAGPTKVVEGVVRDRHTGRPLAGVVISASPDGYNNGINDMVRATSDARGAYRLVGLPKRGRYDLWALPGAGQPYLATGKVVPDSAGLKPLKADFALRRGVVARFRVLDSKTGKPVPAWVQYDPAYSNPLRDEADPRLCVLRSRWPDERGVFEVVAFPGPGILWVFSDTSVRYPPARLDPAHKKAHPQIDKVLFTSGGLGYLLGNRLCPAYRLIDSTRTDAVLKFDVLLHREPGDSEKGGVRAPARGKL
jgi:RNA polymerase sigma factor (sigma-70 family)